VQWIDIVNESALVSNGDALLAEQNKFGMRDRKLLSLRRANCKWTETATAYPLFQLLHVRPINLNQPPTGVKTILIISVIGQSRLVGTARCGVRTAQRAVPTFPGAPSLTDY
jgi:hypothetical protein